jgi:16S rRNA (guanine966-N2)-methyltransferase
MSIRIYGHREIKTLPGLATRPTPSIVREALFNIWQGEVENSRWLDLCSGTGAMGAEAICRGAIELVGIEKDRQACNLIRENWQKVAPINANWQLVNGDVSRELARLEGRQFDRIYFDPPYGSELYGTVLPEIDRLDLLADRGEIAVEHSPNPSISQLPLPEDLTLTLCRFKKYGNTALTFYSWG